MSLFKDFKSGLLGNDYLRDRTHASQVFVSGTHALAPKLKFLFHTYFAINTAVPALRNLYPRSDQARIGLMVKTLQMPSFDIQTEDMNQYNRHRIIQKGIKYTPITIALHDDGSDIIRTLWRQYYSYYYGDIDAPNSDAGRRNTYDDRLATHRWGYQGDSFGNASGEPGVKPPFFSEIVVYAMNQKHNVGYRIVNPMIRQWSHDTYDYSASNGTVQHSMTLDYEYVQYLDNTGVVPGFADPSYYDNTPSPLGKAGSTSSVFGPGGVLDSAGQVLGHLSNGNIAGALLSGVQTVRGAKTVSRGGIREEASGAVNNALRNLGSTGISAPFKR